MKETPTAIIFLDGVKDGDIKRLESLLNSEQGSKTVKKLTYVIVGNSGLSETFLNTDILKNILTTAIRREEKLKKGNRKSRRKKD